MSASGSAVVTVNVTVMVHVGARTSASQSQHALILGAEVDLKKEMKTQ